jgi:hypothetical protein
VRTYCNGFVYVSTEIRVIAHAPSTAAPTAPVAHAQAVQTVQSVQPAASTVVTSPPVLDAADSNAPVNARFVDIPNSNMRKIIAKRLTGKELFPSLRPLIDACLCAVTVASFVPMVARVFAWIFLLAYSGALVHLPAYCFACRTDRRIKSYGPAFLHDDGVQHRRTRGTPKIA